MNKENTCISDKLHNANLVNWWCQLGWQRSGLLTTSSKSTSFLG
jgi:hypothetical protein